MKKLCIICASLLVSISALQAQEFGKGTQTIKLGVGTNLNYWSVPFMVEYEIGIVNRLGIDGLNLGVGGYAGFFHYKKHDWVNNAFGFGPQCFAHYMPVDKLDVYLGTMIGVRFHGGKYSGNDHLFKNKKDPFKPHFSASPVIGARYKISSGFGVYGNFAYDSGMYISCAGVTFEF